MLMQYSRRAFLRASATVPGFALLGCDDPGIQVRLTPPPEPPRIPKELEGALALMRRHSKLGVMVRIPEDYERRVRLGQWFISAIDDPAQGNQDLFALAVFVCVRPSRYDSLRRGEREEACLFDVDRMPLDSCAKFGFRRLIQGRDDSRLTARAERAWTAPDQLAMERLSAADLRRLADRFDALAPWIVKERQVATDAARRATLGELIRNHIETFDEFVEGVRLPFGIEAGQSRGCTAPTEPDDKGSVMVISCGMLMAAQPFRAFARYVVPP